ncbi:hypothetical protein EDD18DRAFT_1107198 [Armillaria luteobubalina]|uniref:Sacsin/Nov domain-containing protein n=1 Tax=Armillaria luteobubalina TaxID=153913 RepID=A0AA39URX0_9AGAR|nr:hypothetical protein EDD18DRAFT_1107198 [Armillaria luteobubalina]
MKNVWIVVYTAQSCLMNLIISARGTNGAYKKLRVIIKELSEEDLATLKGIIDGHTWIPINSRYLTTTSHAVFFLPLPLARFHEIPLALADRPEIHEFLFKMGCMDRASIDVLVTELSNLHKYSALLILKALLLNLNEEEHSKIFVPDVSGQLRPTSEVYFNNLGDWAFIEAGDLILVHPQLNEQIAKHLHMSRLGLKLLHLKKPAVDMGEKLTTTIRNVLKQYTEQQTLTKFFANASDAGATEFKILVDDHHAPFEPCLCNQTLKASEKWEWAGRKLAMIVSGDKVLFLDPSKTHLPFDDWTSLLLPLQQTQRMYLDHLMALNGLYGFKLSSTTSYDGHWSGHIISSWKVEVKADDSTTSDGKVSICNRYLIGYTSPNVEPVQEHWMVVTMSLPVTGLPSKFNPLKEPHRLRSPIIVRLAAQTTA